MLLLIRTELLDGEDMTSSEVGYIIGVRLV